MTASRITSATAAGCERSETWLLSSSVVLAFILAASYVLSGPILMARGEGMHPRVPVLRPVPKERSHETSTAALAESAPSSVKE